MMMGIFDMDVSSEFLTLLSSSQISLYDTIIPSIFIREKLDAMSYSSCVSRVNPMLMKKLIIVLRMADLTKNLEMSNIELIVTKLCPDLMTNHFCITRTRRRLDSTKKIQRRANISDPDDEMTLLSMRQHFEFCPII